MARASGETGQDLGFFAMVPPFLYHHRHRVLVDFPVTSSERQTVASSGIRHNPMLLAADADGWPTERHVLPGCDPRPKV